MSTTPEAGWVPSLASYRTLAALAVFGFHISSIEQPSGAIGEWTIPLGGSAVSLFFALSGFLIYRPFAAWAFGVGPQINSRRFILRRAARILPLYWVVLSVHLFVFGRGGANSFGDYLTAYTLVQNFRGALVFIPPFVAWSLSIELWFSFLLPSIAAVLRWSGRDRNLRTRLIVQLFGFSWLASLAIVFRIWALDHPRGEGQLLWMPAYLDWFAVGIVFAILVTYWRVAEVPITVRRLASYPKPMLLAGFASYWAVTRIGIPSGFVATTPFQAHSQFLLQGLTSLCLMGAAILPDASAGRTTTTASSRLLAWLAPLSYGIYLIHPVVIDEIRAHWDMPRLPLAIISLFLTVAFAFVLHHRVEKTISRVVDSKLSHLDHSSSGDDEQLPAKTEGVLDQQLLSGASEATEQTPRSSDNISSDVEPALPTRLGHEQAMSLVNKIPVLGFLSLALTSTLTLLAVPGRYVADARYELFVNPGARFGRSFIAWDTTRDLGRAAEEFWPGLVLFTSMISALGAPAWVNQRLLHAVLLTAAASGAMVLVRVLGRTDLPATLIAGVIYAFGPFSASYLLPSPLYVSYAIAPWIVVAIVRSSRDRSPLRWAGVASLLVFLAGNADLPGLVYALVPALLAWLALLIFQPTTRRPLGVFSVASMLLTGLASSAMLAKTAAGSAALSHRLIETESPEAVASASSFAESLRGMGFWLSYFRLSPIPLRSQGHLFLDNWFMVAITFVPLIAGVAALARQHRRANLLALGWVLSAVVLMSGPHPTTDPSPYGRVLLSLYEQSDFAFGFRSSHKAGVGLALGTAVLGASGLSNLAASLSSRLRSATWLPAVLVTSLLLTLSQPFWRTPLYDPAFSSVDLPDHWVETAQWFEENPPAGRVLVLPGSTINGYRWGSVGDDLLDPIVPSRLTASTLPLSTPLSADLTEALNQLATSDSYTAGTLAPIASRLGISHVVIRNDLDWEIQGLARPRDLTQLRAETDLVQVAAFGDQGLFSVSPLDPEPDPIERELPAVEILAIHDEGAPIGPQPTIDFARIAEDGSPRQIVLSGDGFGFLQAASQGLLEGKHPVRYSATLDNEELVELAADIALLIVTDTNLQRERRISYYGFDEVPLLKSEAALSDTANHWLPDFTQSGSSTTVDITAGTVQSSVDVWLLGEVSQPQAAIDGNSETSWRIPILAQGEAQTWSFSFHEPQLLQVLRVQLLDEGIRAKDIEVRLDGSLVAIERNDQVLEVHPKGAFKQVDISFMQLQAGIDAVGIREVEFDGSAVPLTTTMPNDIARQALADPNLATALQATPLSLIFGHDYQSGTVLNRSFELWRDESFTLSSEIESTSTSGRCNTNILRIDDEPIPVRFVPTGNGRGHLSLCASVQSIDLAAGVHHLEFRPFADDEFAPIRLDSAHEGLAPVQRVRIEPSGNAIQVDAGDLVLFNAAFDPGWAISSDGTLEPVAMDTLTAWLVPESADIQLPYHQSATTLRWTLWLTAIGLGGCVVLIFSPQRRFASAGSRLVTTELEPMIQLGRFRSSVGPLTLGLLCYFFVGPFGLLGGLLGLILRRRHSVQVLFWVGAGGLALVALSSAWPLLWTADSFIDASGEAHLARAVVGFLIVAGSSALRVNRDELSQ